MSYYRTFIPTEEAVDSLRKCIFKSCQHDLSSLKTEIRAYCMTDHDIKDIKQVIEHIRYLLSSMKFDIKSDCYKYAVERYEEDEDKTIWFCGWQYSHSDNDESEEDITSYVTDNLVNFACVIKTPDWFDENEKFGEKLTEIDNMIEYFCDEISLCGDYEIIHKLKDFDITNKENDEDLRETDPDDKKTDCENPKNSDTETADNEFKCSINVSDYSSPVTVSTTAPNDVDVYEYGCTCVSSDSKYSTPTSDTENER